MLVLSRRSGEEILIPQHGIRITVLDMRGGRVRLGITAPKEIGVLRAELHDGVAGAGTEKQKKNARSLNAGSSARSNGLFAEDGDGNQEGERPPRTR